MIIIVSYRFFPLFIFHEKKYNNSTLQWNINHCSKLFPNRQVQASIFLAILSQKISMYMCVYLLIRMVSNCISLQCMLCPIPHQSVGNFILCIFDERIVYPGTSTSMMNMDSLDSMDPLFSSSCTFSSHPSPILVGIFFKLSGKWPEKNIYLTQKKETLG